MSAHEYKTLTITDEHETYFDAITLRRGEPIADMIGVIFSREHVESGIVTQYPEILMDASEICALHEFIVGHISDESAIAAHA